MKDYSIEIESERIVDSRTKRFFQEVYGCYSSGFYRSAVVMLWSVVISDLLFKLDHLANAYNDKRAHSILDEIKKIRSEKPKSPEWESELIDQVCSKTDLIDVVERTFIDSLQRHRHLSAHPIITSHDVLFSPNKETTRAHIRNILDCVLTKPPMMSRKIFDSFIEDVERLGKLSSSSEGLQDYLIAKYFRYFSDVTFSHIFKSLWSVTFKSTDPRCEANRQINASALNIVFSYKKDKLTEFLISDREQFSDICISENVLDLLASFFRSNKELFQYFTDSLKIPLVQYSSINIDNFAKCWFLAESVSEHVENIFQRVQSGENIDHSTLIVLLKSLETHDSLGLALQIGIFLYCKSRSFDTADLRFNDLIRPWLPFYKKDNFVTLLSGCEDCTRGQAIHRGSASMDHEEVLEFIKTKELDIDINDYPAFKKTLADI